MKHLVIPDTQVKPNSPTDHLRWAGLYAAEKKPDVIIHIGDHFDMPSLSSWDVEKSRLKAVGTKMILRQESPQWKCSCNPYGTNRIA